MTRTNLRFVLAAVLLGSTALFLQAHTQSEVIPSGPALHSFPQSLGTWNGTDLPMDKDILEVLGPGDFLLRLYHDQENRQPPIDLLIAYFPSQRGGDTIHSPQHCLPGAGWTPVENRRIWLTTTGHAPFRVNRYLIQNGDDRRVVLYWYWAHDRGVASEYWAKFFLVADSIRMNRTDGALVRMTTPMDVGETADSAVQRLLPFANSVMPLLESYIPR